MIVILHSAIEASAAADEQDTLVQVENVSQTLSRLGYRVEAIPVTLDLETIRQRLIHERPRLVFNLLESVAGSGRLSHLLPALLDELAIPYTGTSHTGLFLSSNKILAKQWLAAAGLATPAWSRGSGEPRGPGPWLVKSVWEHASFALDDGALLETPQALTDALAERRARLGGEWFAERYIEGREFNLSLLAGREDLTVLAPAEIRFQDYPPGKPRIVGYAAKWDPTSFEYQHTVRHFDFSAAERPLLHELRTLALRCSALFGLRGYARVDFRVDARGRPWLLEINANPCLAPDAGFMAAAGQTGLNFTEVIQRIVSAALAAEPLRNPCTGTGP